MRVRQQLVNGLGAYIAQISVNEVLDDGLAGGANITG